MENDKFKVSIIVPIYNVEKYVEKCIESIIKQRYQNIEIILVDDGSQDNSGYICDKYAEIDTRIKVVHKKNLGVSEARNTGIDMATGDYICFVDGDDYVMSDYVEYLLKLAVDNDTNISLTTEMFGNFQNNQIKREKVEIWTGEETTAGILCYRIPIGVYCKIFKRSFILNKKVRFIPELFIGEGFNFNTAAFQRTDNVAVGNRRVYYYRRDNSTSATTKFSIEKWQNGLYAIDIIKKNLIIDSELIRNAWQYAYWRTNSDIFDIMVLASVEKEYSEFYKKCLKVTRREAVSSLKVNISKKDKIRALVMMICPKLIPFAMILRRKLYHVDIKN